MCVSPIKIKNPNFRSNVDLIKASTNTKDKYLLVPCGVCHECHQMRQMALVQRCRVMALDHYIFFCTLTYNPESLPVHHVNGYDIPYCDVSDVQKMFKRIRKDNSFGRPFKYFFVSERGKDRGRPH